jgi:CBS domain-containing protein
MAKAGALTAAELMTSPAVTVRADATLVQAARQMAHHHVKRLPVVDQLGLLVGIVSRGDLLKVFLRPDAEMAEEVRREVVAYLFFGDDAPGIVVKVQGGVVTLTGRVPDTVLVPARLARAVEGVVDVQWDISGQNPVSPLVVGPSQPEGARDDGAADRRCGRVRERSRGRPLDGRVRRSDR